jgi:ketosteroid isomerase-like protein
MNIIQKRRHFRMIGAIIAKGMARSGFDNLNRHDLAESIASWAEDGIWTFPGNIPISGETKGKKAIEAAFAKWMERFPKINFTIKEIFVSNIFALGATNNIAVEWDIEEADREGQEFHNSGVTIIRVKGGKAVSIKEYIFDADSLKEAWKK